jgi:hypothetical protein
MDIDELRQDDSPDRRRYRLGMLTLVTEASVPATRFEAWLPRTGDAGDLPPAIALWVGGSEKREAHRGSAPLVTRGVALWVEDKSDHASLLCPAGHAELDLEERWGSVSPRDGTSDLGALLSASTAILMGRAGAVLMDASAIIDSSGGGWMVIGPREDRSTLVHAFVRDGFDYVSDDQLVVRGAYHQAGLVVLESWHRPTARARQPATALPRGKWRAMAQFRGVLLARTISSRTPLPWRAVTREQTLASLVDASPHLHSDPVMVDALHALLASCAARPAFAVLSDRELDYPSGNAVRQLASAIDSIM